MIQEHIREASDLKQALLADEEFISSLGKAIDCLCDCFRGGRKILIAGNGGSAADAQHFASEFVGRYKKERRAYPAIALTTDTSAITAWSNDYSFETLFARKVEAFGQPGDVFIGISTSGNSKNIIEAMRKAKDMNLTTVAFLGKGGGMLKGTADVEIMVPSHNTPRVQESHIMAIHIICEEVEKKLHPELA